MKKKSRNLVGTQDSAQFPIQKLIFGTSGQNLCKNRYQSFLVLSNFT